MDMLLRDSYNQSLKKYIWIPFSLGIVVLSLLLVNTGNTSIRVVGLLSFVIIALFLKPDSIVILMALVEPFSIVFKLQDSFSVMPFLFIILFVKSIPNGRKYPSKVIMPLLALMSIGLIVVFARGFSITSFLSFYLYLICVVVVLNNENICLEHVFEVVSIWYVISVLIECILSEYLPNAVSMVTKVSIYNLRNIGFSNEWEFGRHLVVAVAFCLTNILKRKRFLLAYIVAIVYLIYKLTSTGLYSGLLAIGILIMCLPFIYKGSMGKRVLFFTVTILISAGLLLLAYYYVYIPMYNLRGQFTDNGRFNTWLAYLHDLGSNISLLLFGAGAGCISDYAASVHRITAHNILLEKVVEFGIFGLIGLISLIKNSYKGYTFKLNENLNLFPLIGFLGTTITQGVTGSELVFILMMICAMRKEKLDSPERDGVAI